MKDVITFLTEREIKGTIATPLTKVELKKMIKNGEDITYADTSGITNMDVLFKNNKKITKLDLSSWDTSNVTSMKEMFSDCPNLTSIKLNASMAKNTANMFFFCRNLSEVILTNTNNVLRMEGMFYGCSKLKEIKLNTKKVTNMWQMFRDCGSLKSVIFDDVSNVTDMNSTFKDCYDFEQKLDKWVVPKLVNKRDTFTNSGLENNPPKWYK